MWKADFFEDEIVSDVAYWLSSCWDGQYPLESIEGVSVHLEFGFNMSFSLQGRRILLLHNPERKRQSVLISI